MSYSREYLQSIPELRKQETIDWIVGGFIQQLKQNASEGKTQYWVNLDYDERGCRRNNLHVGAMMETNKVNSQLIHGLTINELIHGLQNRFPGCKISYEESWVETNSNTRTLKKGILIDWS